MKKNKNETLPQPTTEKEGYLFGYELIRDVLLPELLGKDNYSILYWSGRVLARKYPLPSIAELVQFFAAANWGELRLYEETAKSMTFELRSDRISDLLTKRKQEGFQLEAGFLAEQVQQLKEKVTETHDDIKRGTDDKIIFMVQWDRKDDIKDVPVS